MGRTGRRLEHDQATSGNDLADPFAEYCAKAGFRRSRGGKVSGHGVAGLAAAAQLDGAQLVEIAADRRLGDVEAKLTES